MATGIIITYGPATDKEGVFEQIVNDVDIVRINMAHGDEQQWTGFVNKIRNIAAKAGRNIKLLADMPGPKIRLGDLKEPIKFERGQQVTLACVKKDMPAEGVVPLDYELVEHVKKGSLSYIGDGRPVLEVAKIGKGEIICTAVEKGVISSRKGVFVRGLSTIAPPTDEDLELAKIAIKMKFDIVGISFVMEAEDIRRLRKVVGNMPVVAKIERALGLENIDDIAKEADMIMVARGDLAYDIGVEMIPVAQLQMIKAAKKAKKPVIVATQMLMSMTGSPIPTRAEVSDVGHAVLDGADYTMLSEESAIGNYPVETVKTMHQTIENMKKYIKDQ